MTTAKERILSTPLRSTFRGDQIGDVRVDVDGYHVATISTKMNDRLEYAKLFAAAPKLVKALLRLRNCPDVGLDELSPETIKALDDADDALRAAGWTP